MFSIDKFHFKNHVDLYCQEHVDPNTKPDLDNVNTEICEQLFVHVNQHRNCKSMNEARFFMFWTYQMHLHNLQIEGLDAVMPNPHVDFR